MAYSVYRLVCLVDGMIYIGLSGNMRQRRQAHRHSPNFKKKMRIADAIREHGWENFEVQLMAEDLTKDEACRMEQMLILEWNTRDRSVGYNNSKGGALGSKGCKHSEEANRKKSERFRGEGNGMFGKTPDEASRRSMALAQHKRASKNRTGFRGVKKAGHRYLARIEHCDKSIHLYDTPEEAHAAYCRAVAEIRDGKPLTLPPRKQLFSTNTSGHRGVFWDKTNKRWVAYIHVGNRCHSLGHHRSKEGAIAARQAGEVRYWGRAAA